MGLFSRSKEKREIAKQQKNELREKVEREIIQYIQEIFDYEEVSIESTLDDLGMDNLDFSELIIFLEDIFDVRTDFSVDDDEIFEKFKTLEDVVDYFVDFM